MTLAASSYRQQAIWQAYRVLGSLEMLGNPVHFFTSVNDGIKEFVAHTIHLKPFTGARCLALSSASGSLHTISLLARAGGSTVALLGLDSEFRNQRSDERIRGETGGVLWSTGRGLVNGVTGVVTNPVRGASTGGVLGFAHGITTGVLGVVVKPVAGFFDGLSHSTESAAKVMDSARRQTNGQLPATRPARRRRKRSVLPSHDVDDDAAGADSDSVSMVSNSSTSTIGALKVGTSLDQILAVDVSELHHAEHALNTPWGAWCNDKTDPVRFHNYAHLSRDGSLALAALARRPRGPESIYCRPSLERALHLKTTLGVKEALKYAPLEDVIAVSSWVELRRAFSPEEFKRSVAPMAFAHWKRTWLT